MQLFGQDTRGQWEEQDFDSVQHAIRKSAGDPDIGPSQSLAAEAREVFEDSRAEIVSILSVMLEERDDTIVSQLREEFSNIHGIGQIRFPKGDIAAKFEKIREVLEREGLIES